MSLFLERAGFQSKAINHLQRIISSSRVPHALMFTGPEGVGKHFTALQFIKEVNSLIAEKEVKFKSKINELEEPYVKFVCALPRGPGESSDDLPTAKLSQTLLESVITALNQKKKNPFAKVNIEKAQNIKISSIRDIRKYLSLNYESELKRAIILHEAHKMSIDSQNAILKSLEEPPENTVFILHTSEPLKLLPTIRSRCQEINFNPLSPEDVIKLLVEYYNYDPELIASVANFADGSVTKAVHFLENDFEGFIEKCINILRYSLGRRFNTALNYFDDILKDQGPAGFYFCIEVIQKCFIDVLRNREGLSITYFSGHTDTIEKFNTRYKNRPVFGIIDKLNFITSIRDSNINLNVCVSNVILEIGHIGIG